jgi:hypothetical protein
MEPGHGPLTGQHHAGLQSLLTDPVGQHLVDGDAAMDDRTFADRHARQHVAGHRRMNPLSCGRLVEQAVNDVDLRLERFQRRQ